MIAISLNLKLLVTTRYIDSIMNRFTSSPQLQVRTDSGDLNKYIRSRIQPLAVQVQPQVADEICRSIIAQADGMFLVAKLNVDSLASKASMKTLKQAVKNLSGTLNDLYDNAIQRIHTTLSHEFRNLAKKALHWVASTYRPLPVDALLVALAIEPGEKHFDPDGCPSISLVLDICAGLLILDEQSKVIRLVHYTLQDYVNAQERATYTKVHCSIARICMTYLDFGCTVDHSKEIEERGEKYSSADNNEGIGTENVFIFTALLFLSGYVLQQQTVRSLQAAIKPQPAVVQPPPSPVLAKHFDTPPGHSFFDKYLASNRPKGGWAKVAYVQLLREHLHVCNAVMLFAVLEEQDSLAQRVILYPKEWDEKKEVTGKGLLDINPQVETSKRLLREAAKRYKVMLQPIKPMIKFGDESVFPLAGLLSLSGYNRVVYLPPSGLILDSSGLDHLFTLPMESTMLGISAGSEDETHTPSIVLMRPSKESFKETLASLTTDKSSEEEFLGKIPLLPDLPDDQIHVLAKTSGLRDEDDAFDADKFMDGTSYVHISDPDILGPEYDVSPQMLASVRPMKPEPKKAWQDIYEKYRQQRMDVCGLDLEPVPKLLKDPVKAPGQETLS
ncbi:MAG: hypothetical protein Q9228_007184 [Teloschistes exilis]